MAADGVLEAPPPRFTADAVATIAAELFGLEGAATDLGSERDQTFLIDDGAEGGVLKISNLAEDPAVLDLECEALPHIGRVDHLDVVNLRQHGRDSIAEHFGALAELRDAGLIRHLGISNVRPQHLAQAQAIAPVVCVQNRYGIDKRISDNTLRTCGEQGIAFVPFYAIAGDRREAGGVADNDAILAIARAHGATPAQVRIAWTLSRGPHVLAIPGTGNPDHLAENLAAGALRLSADELASLE